MALKKAAFKPVMITRREKEILLLLADGFKTTEIARKCYLSEDTISTHRKNIIKKFSAKNITDAVVKAMRHGLIK